MFLLDVLDTSQACSTLLVRHCQIVLTLQLVLLFIFHFVQGACKGNQDLRAAKTLKGQSTKSEDVAPRAN